MTRVLGLDLSPMPCYICAPDDPNAAEEGCSDCELAWEMYVEELLS